MRRSLALFNLLIINFTHGQFEEVVDDSLILFNGTLGVLEANRSVIQNAQFDWSLVGFVWQGWLLGISVIISVCCL